MPEGSGLRQVKAAANKSTVIQDSGQFKTREGQKLKLTLLDHSLFVLQYFAAQVLTSSSTKHDTLHNHTKLELTIQYSYRSELTKAHQCAHS